MYNKIIAVITAGILAAGLLVIASATGNVMAASSGGTAGFGGAFTSHAEANPGQSSTSAGGGLDVFGQPAIGTSSSASDHGSASSAAGAAFTPPLVGPTCGGSSTAAGSCSLATP